MAQEEGYFADEGLNVTLTQFSSAAEIVSGLESEKLDVAFIGSVPSLTFQSQGHSLTVFGGAMTNGHGYVIRPEFVENSDITGIEFNFCNFITYSNFEKTPILRGLQAPKIM